VQMKKQNRAIVVVIILAVVVLTALYFYKFKNESSGSVGFEVTDENGAGLPEPRQEAMGVPLKEAPTLDQTKLDEEKMFQLILTDLSACFDLKSNETNDSSPVTIESILVYLQPEMGSATTHVDQWMNWHLRQHDGAERRLRLELNETDDGRISRLVKYFAVDRDGLPVAMELPPEKSENPSDELINQMLKEGDVFFKEKGAMATFAGGEHMDYIEKNGTLSEIEFQRDGMFFRCQGFKSRDSCQCIR
jgi:hypothetical protein